MPQPLSVKAPKPLDASDRALAQEVSTAVRALFSGDDDPHYVIKPASASAAVAQYLGRTWSPKLGALVRMAMEAIGGVRITLREPLWSGVRPRGLPKPKAHELSTHLRRLTRKRWAR